jgi:hypothetical protein
VQVLGAQAGAHARRRRRAGQRGPTARGAARRIGRGPRHQVDARRADEAGDELVGRPVVQRHRRAQLLDLALLNTAMRSPMVMASTWSWVT